MHETLRLLIIDDNPDDRALVIRALDREFPDSKIEQIIEAKGLAQTLEVGDFDLVITDYQLRWSDGLAVLRAVKERYPDCPVIMFTATGNEEIAVEAMKSGIEDYILKSPRHFVRLPIAVRSALENIQQRQALKEAESRYQSLFDNVPVGLYRSTPAGQILDANPAMVQMLGYPDRKSLLEVNVANIYVNPEVRKQCQSTLESEGVMRNFEVQMRCCDGSSIWVANNSRAILDADSQVQYYEGRMADITERKKAKDQIVASLKEKEVLLREIHHRVKNNLQVISSLLNLQSNYSQDEKVFEALNESKNRVRSMAFAHELLCQSEDLAQVDFDGYIRSLTGYLFQSYIDNLGAITLNINVDDDISLDLDAAIPCGLIINELVSNSIKHAFPEGARNHPENRGKESEIRVELTHTPIEDNDGNVTLIVSDNGVGFPKDLDFRNTESLGLQLVASLTDQLHGTIELDRSCGTAFHITFRG